MTSYIVQANYLDQTSDGWSLVVAALAGIAVVCLVYLINRKD